MKNLNFFCDRILSKSFKFVIFQIFCTFPNAVSPPKFLKMIEKSLFFLYHWREKSSKIEKYALHNGHNLITFLKKSYVRTFHNLLICCTNCVICDANILKSLSTKPLRLSFRLTDFHLKWSNERAIPDSSRIGNKTTSGFSHSFTETFVKYHFWW